MASRYVRVDSDGRNTAMRDDPPSEKNMRTKLQPVATTFHGTRNQKDAVVPHYPASGLAKN